MKIALAIINLIVSIPVMANAFVLVYVLLDSAPLLFMGGWLFIQGRHRKTDALCRIQEDVCLV